MNIIHSHQNKHSLTHTHAQSQSISTAARRFLLRLHEIPMYPMATMKPCSTRLYYLLLNFICNFFKLLLMKFIFAMRLIFSIDGNDVVCECAMRALSNHQFSLTIHCHPNLLTTDSVFFWRYRRVCCCSCSEFSIRELTEEWKCGEKIVFGNRERERAFLVFTSSLDSAAASSSSSFSALSILLGFRSAFPIYEYRVVGSCVGFFRSLYAGRVYVLQAHIWSNNALSYDAKQRLTAQWKHAKTYGTPHTGCCLTVTRTHSMRRRRVSCVLERECPAVVVVLTCSMQSHRFNCQFYSLALPATLFLSLTLSLSLSISATVSTMRCIAIQCALRLGCLLCCVDVGAHARDNNNYSLSLHLTLSLTLKRERTITT